MKKNSTDRQSEGELEHQTKKRKSQVKKAVIQKFQYEYNQDEEGEE
jgi:hypothetical protein